MRNIKHRLLMGLIIELLDSQHIMIRIFEEYFSMVRRSVCCASRLILSASKITTTKLYHTNVVFIYNTFKRVFRFAQLLSLRKIFDYFLNNYSIIYSNLTRIKFHVKVAGKQIDLDFSSRSCLEYFFIDFQLYGTPLSVNSRRFLTFSTPLSYNASNRERTRVILPHPRGPQNMRWGISSEAA